MVTMNEDGRPEWASEMLRKLDAIWACFREQGEKIVDLELRVRSLEATRTEHDRLAALKAGG
jgi:hypothetical protein